MGFVNGYATEDDIKIELFLFEPEQISDLVLVPIAFKLYIYLSKLNHREGDTVFITTFDYWINYPFAFYITSNGGFNYDERHPFLFQRFNPYNKPFADEYSIKLFNFFNQFSNFFISDRTIVKLKNYDYDTNSIPYEFTELDLTNKVFEELNINTPNNNLSVEFSYYYPEIRDSQFTSGAVWEDYYYPRISNQCLECPYGRYWLLNFNSINSNGEPFTIRKDILINSLVINFIDRPDLDLHWTDEDKEFILNQIPDYYLYDNLDNFFSELTNDLLSQSSVLLNDVEILKSITTSYEFGYNKSIKINYLNYEYVDYPIDLQPKLLIFANNNNWNNDYDWIGEDNKPVFNDINNLIYLRNKTNRHYFIDENDELKSVIHLQYSFFLYNNTFDYQDVYNYSPRPSDSYSEDTYYSYNNRRKFYSRRSVISSVPINKLHVLFYDEIKNLSLLVAEHWEIFFTPEEETVSYHYKYKLSFYDFDYKKTSLQLYTLINSGNELDIELENEPEQGYNGFESFSTNENTVEFTFNDSLKRLPSEEFLLGIYNEIILGQENCYMASCDLEEIKKEVKEIHAALDAGKFAYLDGSTENQRVSNLGYYVERIARVLGISVNSDGSIRSIRQSKIIDKGDTIPSGWNIAQWGRNNGANEIGQEGGLDTEEKDGLAWEIKSNKFVRDEFTGEPTAIAQGGYALVENIPQLLHLIFEDLDRAFGLQDAGANVVPTPDGKQIVSYQGINTMMLDILYMLSQMSRNTSGAHISSLKNQAMLQEIFAALGQPTTINELSVKVSNDENLLIPIPATLKDNPTLMDMLMLVLVNLSLVVGSKIEVKPEE